MGVADVFVVIVGLLLVCCCCWYVVVVVADVVVVVVVATTKAWALGNGEQKVSNELLRVKDQL